ncbi:hypothetical protein FRC01_010899, partial [Tulasnella sp. 417]
MADHDTRTAKPRGKKPNKTKMIGNWHIGRTIGRGSSGASAVVGGGEVPDLTSSIVTFTSATVQLFLPPGHVRIARHAKTGEYAAVKIVSKHALVNSRMSMAHVGEEEDKILLAIEREIVIMKLIDHPNVLSLYHVWETKSELYLVMEYVQGGELFDYLQRGRRPVAEAPENVLLDKDRNIKVADFGMAASEGGNDMLKTSCGSPHYASPEVVAGEVYHGPVSDIWSCGVILYALLAGRLPFDDDNIRVLLDKVQDGRFIMPHDIDPMPKGLLRQMLEKDVKKRITIPEILKHPPYLSRAPRPMKVPVISPPTLEEVEKPVKSEDEIDADIFQNVQILWSSQRREKAVYSLLMRYRLKQLENYNMRTPAARKPVPALSAPEAVKTTNRKMRHYRRLSNNPSHSTASTNSTSDRSSTVNPTLLQVPQIGDEAVQQLFKEIVEQLASIQARRSSMMASSPPVGGGNSPDLQALTLAALNFARNPDGAAGVSRPAMSAASPPPNSIGSRVPVQRREQSERRCPRRAASLRWELTSEDGNKVHDEKTQEGQEEDVMQQRDWYLIPLKPEDPIPEFIELLDNVQLPKTRTRDVILAVFVLPKDRIAKAQASAPSSTPQIQNLPLESMPPHPAPVPTAAPPLPNLGALASLFPLGGLNEQTKSLLQDLVARGGFTAVANSLLQNQAGPPPPAGPPPSNYGASYSPRGGQYTGATPPYSAGESALPPPSSYVGYPPPPPPQAVGIPPYPPAGPSSAPAYGQAGSSVRPSRPM